MITLVLYILALIIPLVILFVFSLFIINSALNKKNIKIDLFAFNFDFGRLRRKIGSHEHISKASAEKVDVPAEPITTESESATAGIELTPELPLPQTEGNNVEAACPVDFEDFRDIKDFEDTEDFTAFDDLSRFAEPIQSERRENSLKSSIREKFSVMHTNAEARAIEKEERRLQDDFEMFDPDEIPEEMPEDFGGKIKYFWRNHIGFRIGTCVLVVFLAFMVVFYSFQMRNSSQDDQEDMQNMVSENEEKEEDTTDDNQELPEDYDMALNDIYQGLDDELSPIDVEADSMDEDPNLAEIIETAQSSIGETTATYPGSNTTTQPSGAIGTISIPSINLSNAPVMGSVELDDLAKGTGHFENTPIFDGNVGIAGHNNTHFKYLVNVDIGDTIKYTVNGVTRTYQVSDVRAISDTDWGVFTDYGDNRLTLVTCEHLVPQNRIAVTAIQVGSDSGTSSPRTTYTGSKNTSSSWQDSGDYHDAGSGYTDYIGVFTGNN